MQGHPSRHINSTFDVNSQDNPRATWRLGGENVLRICREPHFYQNPTLPNNDIRGRTFGLLPGISIVENFFLSVSKKFVSLQKYKN